MCQICKINYYYIIKNILRVVVLAHNTNDESCYFLNAALHLT